MNQEQILNTLSEHLPAFRVLGVHRIGLFGSFASGSEGEQSDIDILVEFDGGRKTFDNYMDLKFRLEELFDGRSVDLVVKDALKPTVRPHALDNLRLAGEVPSRSASIDSTQAMSDTELNP